jgi:peptide deformylase
MATNLIGGVVQNGDPVLRAIAKPVKIDDIKGPKIQKLLREMSRVLAQHDDGAALAAPQIGESLQIFIVAGKLFRLDEDDKNVYPDLVFINPRLVKLSKKKVSMEEGCLSCRWAYGETKRSDKATVEAYNEKGQKFTWNGHGIMAQIFQHEIDHFNGILFTDHATKVKNDPPAKRG